MKTTPYPSIGTVDVGTFKAGEPIWITYRGAPPACAVGDVLAVREPWRLFVGGYYCGVAYADGHETWSGIHGGQEIHAAGLAFGSQNKVLDLAPRIGAELRDDVDGIPSSCRFHKPTDMPEWAVRWRVEVLAIDWPEGAVRPRRFRVRPIERYRTDTTSDSLDRKTLTALVRTRNELNAVARDVKSGTSASLARAKTRLCALVRSVYYYTNGHWRCPAQRNRQVEAKLRRALSFDALPDALVVAALRTIAGTSRKRGTRRALLHQIAEGRTLVYQWTNRPTDAHFEYLTRVMEGGQP